MTTGLGVGATVTVGMAVGEIEVEGTVGAGVDVVGVAATGTAAGAFNTTNEVSASEPKYELLPANVAVTLYSPGTGGVHAVVKTPWSSLRIVPMSW